MLFVKLTLEFLELGFGDMLDWFRFVLLVLLLDAREECYYGIGFLKISSGAIFKLLEIFMADSENFTLFRNLWPVFDYGDYLYERWNAWEGVFVELEQWVTFVWS